MRKALSVVGLLGAVMLGVLCMGSSNDRPATLVVQHQKLFSCTQTAVTTTTQCFAAPAAGSIYVQDIFLLNGSTTASAISLVTGTGTNCATGQTSVTPPVNLTSNAAAGATFSLDLSQPIKLPAGQALCCKTAGATAFSCLATGYVGP